MEHTQATMMQVGYIFRKSWFILWITVTLLLTSCASSTPSPAPTNSPGNVENTVELSGERYPQTPEDIDFITIAIDAPSRSRNFAHIDEFGHIQGFEPDMMADIASRNFDYEFVVTSYEGITNSVRDGEFDVAMSAIIIPDHVPEDIVFTAPYLEVGQVLVMRADERTINNPQELTSEHSIGVVAFSHGEAIGKEIANETNLRVFKTVIQTLQALIDREVDAAIIDHDDAEFYVSNYYQQLQTVGGEGREAWITSNAYGIAVAKGNATLLQVLNEAIAKAQANGTTSRLTTAWLVESEGPEKLNAGESLIGTLNNEFVIGLRTLNDVNLDPAAEPDRVSWELKRNTMSGLVMYDANNQLTPILAERLPTISTDKLEYTFRLREGLSFPDGENLTAEDVRWSIMRSASLGNFLVNAYLKDSNLDGFADDDAVQVIDNRTVKIVLDEPTSYFLSLLATPPYFVVSRDCYTTTENPSRHCGSLGAYTIVDWQPNEKISLKANPQWPASPPTFENIVVRLYDNSARMRHALEIEALDVVWIGLQDDEITMLREAAAYKVWTAPATFKSYLVFEQNTPPWDVQEVRQAAAYALDREALSALFEGMRSPLYSPVPDQVPGHLPTAPLRDLERARELLALAGYTPTNPLPITLSYVDDGRYSPLEGAYASLIKEQLEETGVFRVSLEGAAYDTFRQQSVTCNTPAFILGWPPSGDPPYYIDPSHWMEYFVFNTDTVCSNYESQEMDTLLEQLAQVDPTDWPTQQAIYGDIQTLWAEEYPTLDLTQETTLAFSLNKVQQVRIDAMGLMHYDTLNKGSSQ